VLQIEVGRRLTLLVAGAVLAGCGATDGWTDAELCEERALTGILPPEMRESSGLALSRRHAGVLWTHNDSGFEPLLFAIDTAGTALGSFRVPAAENVDWEDIAIGPCPAGDCLYIGDIGDNNETRTDIVLYRLPEPDPRGTAIRRAESFRMRYPDEPQDAESLFVLPDGQVFLITKGRSTPVRLYRYPPPLRAGETVVLELVQELTDAPPVLPTGHVTGADAVPGSDLVAVRTYREIRFYRWTGAALEPALDEVEIGSLGEPQGEGIAVRGDGVVFLSSEEGRARRDPTLWRLACRLPR
jgi:hypothetical protein